MPAASSPDTPTSRTPATSLKCGSAAIPSALAPIPGAASAVVGLQWGDEGKGKIIDLIAGEYDAVVRYNGGANAGHSVVIEGTRYALHQVPSGVFHEGTRAVIANGVVLDPFKLLDELDTLRAQGSVGTGSLALSDRAHVVMPYHMVEDELRETALAKEYTEGERKDTTDRAGESGREGGGGIGTTRRGIGPAYADKATRSTSIRVGDLLRTDVLREKLERIAPMKTAALRAIDPTAKALDPDALAADAALAGQAIRPYVTDTAYLLNTMLADAKSILFEGANATLLDVDHGTYPFVTSSNSTALGIPAGSGVPGGRIQRVVGVLKAYSTRVGSGPFPTEQANDTGDRIRTAGNEYGTTTGRPRRCGWLDLVAARYAVMLNGCSAIAVMLLDVLAGLPEIKLCTSYRVDGEMTDRFLPDAHALAQVEPVYETHPGFEESITHVRQRSDLPPNALHYLDAIEEAIGVPIRIISVGPGREQTIFC